MKVLGLFSGIGGFELGFQRAGFEIAAMCEIEPYARAVLAKHWPKVPVFPDVKELTRDALEMFDCLPDVVTGGFPCQDISLAGKGAGLDGARSGLWREFHRVIEETRPRYAIIENVSALRSRGLDVVLRQLAEIGYDAEWHCIPASAVGAPHKRDRVWIVAHASRLQSGRQEQRAEQERIGAGGKSCADVADAPSAGFHARSQPRVHRGEAGARPRDVESERLRGPLGQKAVADTSVESDGRGSRVGRGLWRTLHDPQEGGRSYGQGHVQWLAEPDVGRVAHGVPSRVDRLRALGNAVVPQIPEIIARSILEAELFA